MYKVVLVEDEAIIRDGLKKLIEEVVSGFQVIAQASNGREALENLGNWLPDLLITDIRMSEMNGIDLIKRVREQYASLPILIISGYGDFEYAKQALRYGVAEYLLKPIDRVELAQFLDKLKKKWEAGRKPEVSANEEAAPPSRLEKDTRQIIRRVKELVLQRLDQEISLQYIAEQVHLNPKYLLHFFNTETGQHFSDFVTETRMNQARRLLKQTNLKIYEIAAMCGYSSTKHFTVAFKQLTELSPSEYRDQNDWN